MSARPYLQKSVMELEAMFQHLRDDLSVLQNLKSELDNRSTQRARSLQKKVLAQIESLPGATATSGASGNDHEPQPIREAELSQEPNPVGKPEQKQPSKPPVQRSDLGPKPPVRNAPQDILRTWTALEVLSPQSYKREVDLAVGDQSRIARFGDKELPWELGEKSRPKKRLYYELILGALVLSPAIEALLKLYSDDRPDLPSMKGFCPIASILLDKNGRPLEDDTSAAISSFAWGVPIALQGNLEKLADWPQQQKYLLSAVRERMIKRDKNDEILPLTQRDIKELFNYLIHTLNLGDQETKAPYFALRHFVFFASKVPPELGLLNSFFLEDLALARNLESTNNLPHALKHYLGVERPEKKVDLLEDNTGLRDLLQPALTPLGRWPGNGRHPLALLQQAAVNASDKRLMKTGILAVNGPPGTGKTTLLRDVVAARIIERAMVMSEFAEPASAYTPTDQSFRRSGAKITLHKLDERLKGFEMIVASSNNKAVENVSAELPGMEAIAQDAPGLRYFKSISDKVFERDTWGVIAAVLGNASNRYRFSQAFWRDEEKGLSTYLNHASGLPQVVSEPQENGPPVKRNREVVDSEAPPANKREALVRWKKARGDFLQAIEMSKASQKSLHSLHETITRLAEIVTELAELEVQIPCLEEEVEGLMSLTTGSQGQALRPGLLACLFRTKRFKEWRAIHEQLLSKQRAIEESGEQRSRLRDEAKQLERQFKRARDDLGAPVPDVDFFALNHEEMQIANVWFDETANRLRDQVFEMAMVLHRAFIDCTADQLRQNLSIFTESFGTRSLGTAQKNALISDMWATFFLVVPVVSTTFASVHRMLSRLPAEALGWLLVDEAGQAPPQAAVGAMMRTKNTVAVGDPLQIEPVVTLPNSLTEEICGYFGVDPLKYNAPDASVQTVADAASMYSACFPTGSGYRDVGAPLLVHRRCDSPMFEISNEVAYSNLMVQAKIPTVDCPILGPSSWIDVVGMPGPDKWCADEATVLIKMLRKLRDEGAEPDLYIITPFVVVQNNLREILRRDGVLDGWITNPGAWIWEHVGTVHTVQGREAEIVFFVLGAQGSSQNGARGWAGGKPNLVNVAVTRAKTSLYVIGNRQLWKSAGSFSVLDRYLPKGSNVEGS